MPRYVLPLLVWLSLAAAMPAIAEEPDCDALDSWAEHALCDNPQLRALDEQMRQLFHQARLQSRNLVALENEQVQWRQDTRNACTDEPCLETAYRTRIDALHRHLGDGPPPLVASGIYHRRDGGPEAPGLALLIQALEPQRYRLRVLSSAPADAQPIEGEFTERIGSARFESEGCAFTLNFAPDLIVVADVGQGCNAALAGNYLLGLPRE